MRASCLLSTGCTAWPIPTSTPLGSRLASWKRLSLASVFLASEKPLVGLVAFPVEILNHCFVLFVFSCFKDFPFALPSASGYVYIESDTFTRVCKFIIYPALLTGRLQVYGLLVFIEPCEFEVVLWLLPVPHIHNFILFVSLSFWNKN